MKRAYSLSAKDARDILEHRPCFLTSDQVDLVQSICANELKYAIPTRVGRLMSHPVKGPAFAAWVNSAARMLDNLRSAQQVMAQGSFLNVLDPLLSSLANMAACMDEVAVLLEQLHRYCPQFDQLFFHGTRFLEGQSDNEQLPTDRVLSSVDVLSLSPEDEEAISQP
jgi:hypothetical protein